MRGRIECSQIRAPACAKYAAEGHEGKGGWVREGGGAGCRLAGLPAPSPCRAHTLDGGLD